MLSALVLAVLAWWMWPSSRPQPRTNTAEKGSLGEALPSVREGRGESSTHIVSQPAPPASVARVNRIALAPWGGGSADQVGHVLPEEANAEGPMSVVGTGDGFLVLDQVNGRVTRWSRDGKAKVQMMLPDGMVAADVAAGADGSVAVLDRLVNKEVVMFDAAGKRVGAFPLDAEVVGESGQVTGVFVDGEDVYVESEHSPVYRVGTVRGEVVSEAKQLPGRPSRDGKLLLSASIHERGQGSVLVNAVDRSTESVRFAQLLTFAGEIEMIVGLDSDQAGTIYLAVAVDQGGSKPTMVTCLEPQKGKPLGTVTIPTNTSPEESLREFTVMGDGTIVFAHRLPEGMAFESYRCP